MHLDENGFVVEDGLVAADADEAVSEHFVKVGAVGEFGKSAENLLAVTEEGFLNRHYEIAFFVKSTAA